MSINIIFHHLKNFFLKTHLSHTIKIFKFLLLRPIKYGLSADIIQDISSTNINYYSTHNVPVYSSRNIETVRYGLKTISPLGKITSRGRPGDVSKKRPMDVPYGPLCNAKGRLPPTSWGRPNVTSWGHPHTVVYVTP